MKTKKIYTIKYVAKRTGLSPHLIRAWERRYQAVVPKRTDSNLRRYCEEDILRLSLLKDAVDAGHRISCIAGESIATLKEIIGFTPKVAPAPTDPPLQKRSTAPQTGKYLAIAIRATIDLKPDTLNRVLSEAAVHLTRRAWIEGLLVPLFHEIGSMWSSGRLKIVNEHVASNCARNLLWEMLQAVVVAPGAPKIVVGTPVGQWHDLGALTAALAASEAGWRAIFIGANLPAEEFASAADQFGAHCIGMSIAHGANNTRLQSELIKLRSLTGPQTGILVGGLKVAVWDALLEQVQAERIDAWDELISALHRLPKTPFS